MNKLVKITLKGYKSIRELELELRPLSILIGANGAGKSNFISVFRFLKHLVDENLQLHVGRSGGADQILYYGRKNTERLVIGLRFEVGDDLFNGYQCSLVTTASDSFVFESETVSFHNRSKFFRPFFEELGAGHPESRLSSKAQKESDVAYHLLQAMQSLELFHFHDTSDSARVKQNGNIDDNISLRQDAANLAAYLFYLRERQEAHYRNIVDFIRLAAPFFDDFALRPNPLNENKIKLEWRERGSDAYFDANSLSDGTLRLMSLATLLLQPLEKMPGIILLDEPELGLHPYAITLLAELIQSTSEKTQIIVATQSVTLVNQFEPEDIIVVDRQGGQSVFKRLSADAIAPWLEDYGLGDLWEKNVLGGRPAA